MTPVFAPIDFERFHRDELPRLLDTGRGAIAAHATRGLRGLAVRLRGGGAYSYLPAAEGVRVVPGDDAAATVVELDLETWRNLVHERDATAGLLYAGRVSCLRGEALDLMSWEPGLRALYAGIPAYDPAKVALLDRRGAPLDCERTFATSGDREEMAHFLRAAGYLFVRGAFSPTEVEAFRRDAEVLRGEARKGDRFSWWGRNRAGEEILCRVTRGRTRPALATLPDDERILALRDLAGEPLAHRPGEGDGVTVIFKNPDMVEGLGDIPWHRDCGMGGHATMCPILIVSVYLTDATPESGELMMLPGSHGTTFNAHAAVPENLPVAHFAARPGDVSLHFGDTAHKAPAPRTSGTGTYRTSAVVGFARPGGSHHRGERSYNDVLHQRDDGQIEHLEQVARRTPPVA